jgi:hypothetical protein
MVERASKRPSVAPKSSSNEPRAKSLLPRDPAVRALDKYAAAAAAYEAAIEERCGLGRIDESYAALAQAAAAVVVAARGATWLSPDLRAQLVAQADRPEDDLRFAELVMREVSALSNGVRSPS